MLTEQNTVRADARRNRARIIEAAKRVFASSGDTGPEAVAREAGVGVGTLYRHFPNRNDLAAAVYEDELLQVAAGAHQLLAETGDARVALRLWMDRFATRLENKRAMAPALHALMDSGAVSSAATRARLATAVQEILDAGIASGSIRTATRGDDLVAALVGVCIACSTAESSEQLGRLLDLVLEGVTAPGAGR